MAEVDVGNAQITNPAIDDLQANVATLVGQSIDDVGSQIDDLVSQANLCWRWLTPTDTVSPSDVRNDRINVNVDANNNITTVTIG